MHTVLIDTFDHFLLLNVNLKMIRSGFALLIQTANFYVIPKNISLLTPYSACDILYNYSIHQFLPPTVACAETLPSPSIHEYLEMNIMLIF